MTSVRCIMVGHRYHTWSGPGVWECSWCGKKHAEEAVKTKGRIGRKREIPSEAGEAMTIDSENYPTLACPQCGDTCLTETTLGALGPVDTSNRASCEVCGWRGQRVIAEVTALRDLVALLRLESKKP